MEDSPKLLEIGMFVYIYASRGSLNKFEIDRVTPKQAFASEYKFERKIDISFWDKKPCVNRIGEYGVAYIETPELISEYLGYKNIVKARNLHTDFNVREIDADTAKKIIDFYESLKPELIDNNTSS